MLFACRSDRVESAGAKEAGHRQNTSMNTADIAPSNADDTSRKISFSFIPLITANNLYKKISRIKNPAIPVRQQTKTDFVNNEFPKQYYVKIGFKYLL
jgi:hypothetical protein